MAAAAARALEPTKKTIEIKNNLRNIRQMFYQSKRLRNFLRKWPGAKTFGIYRFVPVFFFFGAGLEFCMIKWQVGEVNFYKTYKRRRVQEIVEDTLFRESLNLEKPNTS